MQAKLDLRELKVDRAESPANRGSGPGRPSRWLSRVALPLCVLAGFLFLVAAAAGRRLLPVPEVTVVPVVVKRAEVQQAGRPLFQAPGWIEPRPTAITVPALAAGVIEQVHVVEGEAVAKGQPIASLIAIDAEMAVRRARARLAIRESEYARAIAQRDAAERRLRQPVHLEVLVAAAESELADAASALAQLPDAIRAAESEFAFAQENLAGKRSAGAGVSGITLQRAAADLRDAEAKLSELRNRQPNLQARLAALRRKVTALETQLQLLIDEKQQLAEARSAVSKAEALREEARVALEEADLRLSRMQVTAPRDGRVLQLVAAPGDRVMGLDTTAEHRSSTVVRMYDPQRLQARVDVRLEDVPLLVPGQPVQIETAAAEEPLGGYLLQPTSTANIQKNTLEVKVALRAPPPTITPEMLVTATFLSAEKNEGRPSKESRLRLFAPSALVRRAEGTDFVWIVRADERAKRVPVQTGSSGPESLIEIVAGLAPTDKLISSRVEDLTPGLVVRIAGEDERLGLNTN